MWLVCVKGVIDMNLNKLAVEITKKEGKKISVSVSQIKEVMKIMFTKLAKMKEVEVKKILARYAKAKK